MPTSKKLKRLLDASGSLVFGLCRKSAVCLAMRMRESFD
jgi:hypothetical protein